MVIMMGVEPEKEWREWEETGTESHLGLQNGGGGLLFGNTDNGMKSSSAYSEIC